MNGQDDLLREFGGLFRPGADDEDFGPKGKMDPINDSVIYKHDKVYLSVSYTYYPADRDAGDNDDLYIHAIQLLVDGAIAGPDIQDLIGEFHTENIEEHILNKYRI